MIIKLQAKQSKKRFFSNLKEDYTDAKSSNIEQIIKEKGSYVIFCAIESLFMKIGKNVS